MKYLTLLFVIAVGVAGCAQTTANKNTMPMVDTPDTIAKKAAPTGEVETECKICEFDFKAYKGDLKKEEIEGLLLALNDEYLATAIYKSVNEKFEDPRPFVNIIRAEMQHAERLKGLFDKYKMPIPSNKWIGQSTEYETVTAACKAGIDAEIANRDLYERLFKTTSREDILLVYKNLQRASEENHKPAFERCASVGGGKEMGNGRGLDRGNN